jgi:hypothetical protein
MKGIRAGIRQELTWVLYGLASNTTSYFAGVARYAFSQSCSTRGSQSLQWILIAAEASKATFLDLRDWDNADRAEALYRRVRKIERRVMWRKRDAQQREAFSGLKLEA